MAKLASRPVGVVLAVVVALALAPRARAAEPDPWFGRDKALHFGATFALAGGGYAGAALFSPREGVRAAAGAGLGLGAGIAKEIYDRYSGGDPSWRDLAWDVVGTATSVLTAWLLDRYVFWSLASFAAGRATASCRGRLWRRNCRRRCSPRRA